MEGFPGYIYLVTNTVNGKRYVGKTTRTVFERWESHIRSRNNKKLQALFLNRAIRNHSNKNRQVLENHDPWHEDQIQDSLRALCF